MNIERVDGPDKIFPNHTATFEAVLAGRWSQQRARALSWCCEVDGRVLAIYESAGPRVTMGIPEVAAGRSIVVRPYSVEMPLGESAFTAKVAPLSAPSATTPTAPVAVTIRQDKKKWWAQVDSDPEFLVGEETKYGSRRGLFNTADPIGPFYVGPDWEAPYGFWARLLEPTAKAEGERFNTLNTYDSAAFTFGFIQFAAHTPNDNFVLLFRALLSLPAAAFYFPDLSLKNGRIAKGGKLLETASTTDPLMAYLNPDGKVVEPAEAECSARLIHWVRSDADARNTQVSVAVEKMKKQFKSRGKDLHGHSDVVCLLVWDILHQGRAKAGGYQTKIVPALKSADPEGELLQIGEPEFPGRVKTLISEIARLRKAGVLGKKTYDKTTGAFA
jgi:hypothetical protein